MGPCLVLVAVVTALWCESNPGASAAEYFSRTYSKLSAATMVAKSDARNVPYFSSQGNLWNTIRTSSVSEEAEATTSTEQLKSKKNTHDDSSGGPGDSPQTHANNNDLASSFMVHLDSPDTHTEIPSVISPMESLKQIWRGMIAVPPSAAQLELILKGSMHGYETSTVHTLSTKTTDTHNPVEATITTPVSTPSTPSTTQTTPSILNTTLLSNQHPLRANGTHKESLYRQVLSQFLNPLATDGKRSLWLDQELVLKLKGSVVFAHHPELWRDIGEGLKPKLNRGVRLLTPYVGGEEPPGNVYVMFLCVYVCLSVFIYWFVLYLE